MSCRDLVLQTLTEGTELLLHAGLLEPLELFAFKCFSENRRMSVKCSSSHRLNWRAASQWPSDLFSLLLI